MPEEGSAKQNLGDPPAIIVQVIIGPARQKWDIPRSNPGDIYLLTKTPGYAGSSKELKRWTKTPCDRIKVRPDNCTNKTQGGHSNDE